MTITRWPPGRAGLRGGSCPCRNASRCRCRDIVRSRSLTRPIDEYEVPCSRDWVVLDALNYIKDSLDGTLSYRWSCRMGVCGSCGMTVNGEPKLTCATFLADYAPGPVRVEPLRNFPVIRDLVVDIGDFMRKLVRVKPWIVRAVEEAAGGGRVPPDARGAGRVQAVQHVHQLHALLCGVPDLRPRSAVHRPGRDCAGAALQPRLP